MFLLLLSLQLSHQYLRLDISKVRKIFSFSTLPQAPSLSLFLMSLYFCCYIRLSLLGLPQQNITNKAAYTIEVNFLTVLEAGHLGSKCWQCFISYEVFLFVLQMVTLLLTLHMAVPLCSCTLDLSLSLSLSLSVLISSSYMTSIEWDRAHPNGLSLN